MGPDPTNTSVIRKSCPEVVGSNCVLWDGDDNLCLGLCKKMRMTDVVYKEAQLICSLLSQLTQKLNTEPGVIPPIDFSQLDLGCLWTTSTTVWTCPFGQTFLPDITAPNGKGFCQTCTPPPIICSITSAIPVGSLVLNPTPRPTTLIGILQLIINKIPCCDPCK